MSDLEFHPELHDDALGLSKPTVQIVEKVAEFIGIVFAPAVAAQEVLASLIKAKGNIAIEDIKQRADNRREVEGIKHQQSLEAILAKAAPQILEDAARPENVDPDWFNFFSNRARHISDDEMSNLWASILAGEINKPGTYSKRLLAVLESMSRKDAEQFKALCSVCGNDDSHLIEQVVKARAFIYDIREPVYSSIGINMDTLLNLQSIGLISTDIANCYQIYSDSYDIVPRGSKEIYLMDTYSIVINGSTYSLEMVEHGYLPTGIVALTQLGDELARLCEWGNAPGFGEYLTKTWNSWGYTVNGVAGSKVIEERIEAARHSASQERDLNRKLRRMIQQNNLASPPHRDIK